MGVKEIEYEQWRDLAMKIAATRSAMQLPSLDVRYMKLVDLRRIWYETLQAAKDTGTIE